MGNAPKSYYIEEQKLAKAEYDKRAENREKIRDVLLKMKESTFGSNFPYVANIGGFHFSRNDFESAIVTGEHPFYGFSEWSAMQYLKGHYPELHKELSNIIDTGFESRKLIDPARRKAIMEDVKKSHTIPTAMGDDDAAPEQDPQQAKP